MFDTADTAQFLTRFQPRTEWDDLSAISAGTVQVRIAAFMRFGDDVLSLHMIAIIAHFYASSHTTSAKATRINLGTTIIAIARHV